MVHPRPTFAAVPLWWASPRTSDYYFRIVNRVLAIAVVCALLVLGAGWFLIGRPPEPATPAKDATFEPAPTRDASRAEAPSRESSRPVAPPRAAPPVATAPADAPAPAPTVGTLHIDSDVPGALVFIDRKSVGRRR